MAVGVQIDGWNGEGMTAVRNGQQHADVRVRCAEADATYYDLIASTAVVRCDAGDRV